MTIKGSTQEEDVIFYSFYTMNMGVSKYLKQMLTKREKWVPNTSIAADCNAPFTSAERSSDRKSIRKH